MPTWDEQEASSYNVVVVVVIILYFLQHIEDFATELNRQKRITLQTGVKKKGVFKTDYYIKTI